MLHNAEVVQVVPNKTLPKAPKATWEVLGVVAQNFAGIRRRNYPYFCQAH
jgi:hypothetical protein